MLTDILEDASFAIEKPSYPPIKQVLDKKKFNYLQVPVEKNGIQTHPILSSDHNIIYITPSHQFPTGHVMNLKKEPNSSTGLNNKIIDTLSKMIMIQNLDILVNLSLHYRVLIHRIKSFILVPFLNLFIQVAELHILYYHRNC